MSPRILPLLIGLPLASLHAAEQMSAVAACKALSTTQQRSMALLSAHAGKPSPEKWTIVIHDSKAPKGIRECTVSAGTIVSSRTTSDLATKISSTDVIGVNALKVDSDQVAELAASYAEANQAQLASFDYDLRKVGADAAPLWTVSAFDEAGTRLGTLVVAANSGAVISHEGFAVVPATPDLSSEVAATTPEETEPESKEVASKSESKTTKPSTPKKRVVESDSDDQRERRRPGTFRRIGGRLEKFFTGKNTIGR